jgi:putative oxidoreductase
MTSMTSARSETTETSKARRIGRIAGIWTVTLIAAALSILVGVIKFSSARGWDRAFAHWGYPTWARPAVGAAEITAGVLMLAPPTAAYGGALMASVMFGAIGTHVVHHEWERVVPPTVLCTLSCIVLSIRRHRAIHAIKLRPQPKPQPQ